jgi:hypothetical protein
MKIILEASKQPYLSLGVRYGGIKFQGKEYSYIPTKDAFILSSLMPKYRKHFKSGGTWEEFLELNK